MNDKTVITYENEYGVLTFQKNPQELWLESITGATGLTVELSTAKSPGQVGSTITSQSIGQREITLDGCIFDPVETNRARILSVIMPRVVSRLTVENNGRKRWIDVVPERTPDFEDGVGVQAFQTKVVAAFPYWTGGDLQYESFTNLEPMFEFPFVASEEWYVSKYSDVTEKIVINNGNVPYHFDIEFRFSGSVWFPMLTHIESGKFIQFKGNYDEGDSFFVSTKFNERKIDHVSRLDGQNHNGFRFLSIDSDLTMEIMPGRNTFIVGADEGKNQVQVNTWLPDGAWSYV